MILNDDYEYKEDEKFLDIINDRFIHGGDLNLILKQKNHEDMKSYNPML